MRQAPPPKTWFQKIEKLHPYETLLYLGMLGSGIIFLFLSLAFLSSGREYLQGLNEQMPLAFLVSTFLLVLSGYTSVKMRIHYQEENSAKLHRSLKATFVLGILFTVFQVLGWMELANKGIKFYRCSKWVFSLRTFRNPRGALARCHDFCGDFAPATSKNRAGYGQQTRMDD